MYTKLRTLKVPTIQDGLKRMQAYLFANMIDNELEVDDPRSETPNYFVKFVWLYRNAEEDDKIGCPCFACDFRGILPNENDVHGIIYVKVFADREYLMTKMLFVEENANFNVVEICDGEEFKMHDESGRYEDEMFLYKGGTITKID